MFSHGHDGDERHWQHVLQLLAHPSEAQQLACLTELQQWLSFATDEHLGSFPLQRVLHALFLLLQRKIGGSAAAGGAAETARNVQTDASESAAALSQEALDEQLARELAGGVDDGMTTHKDLLIGSCVYLLLDVLPMQTAAVIARTPEYMEALKHQLSHLQYIDTGEKFLLILCRVIDEQPLLSFSSGAAAAILPILDFFQLDIQRKAVRAAAKALAAAAAATDKAVASAAAETAARRLNFSQLQQLHQQQCQQQQQQQQQQSTAGETVPPAAAAGLSGGAESIVTGETASSCDTSDRSKLASLQEQLQQQLQQEKEQHRELVGQLEEYRSLINPTLPFFSSLLSYKDEALLQGACQSWRSTLTIFVCMNTAAAASAAAVAGLGLAVERAAIDGTGSTELGSTQQQQQTEDDAEWLSICQKAYADRMELLAGELAVAGSAAASALQQLVARTIAECNTSALAWQQQLMLQDAMYVLSVFAAYSDKIAAELLQQQTQTSDFQEAVNKLVKRQEMLLLESVAALGVSLLPAVRFKLPLQHPAKIVLLEAEASARAADVLTVDEHRAAVFSESPELLGRVLHTLAAPMLPLMESSVTRDLSSFVLQLLLAAACTAAKAKSNQNQLQQQFLRHLDVKTLGEICAHTLSMGLPAAVNFAVMNLVLQLLVQHGPAAAAALQAAGVRDRVEVDLERSRNSSSTLASEDQQQSAGDGTGGTMCFVIRAATGAAAAAAGEPVECVDLVALLRRIREACLVVFEKQLQQPSPLGGAPLCTTQQRLRQVASCLAQQGKQPVPAEKQQQQQQQQQHQWWALVELRKLLEDPTVNISACEIISSQLAEALCCYLLGTSSSSDDTSSMDKSPCYSGSCCRSDCCREQQELRERGLLFLRAFLFPLTDSSPEQKQQQQQQAHGVLDGVDWSAASPELLLRLAMLAAKCLSRVEQFPVLQHQLPAVVAAARDVLPPHLRAPRPPAGGTMAAAAAGRQPGCRTAGLQQRPRPTSRGLRAFQQVQQQQLSHYPGELRRQQLVQQQLMQQPDPLLVVQDLQRDIIIVARDIKGEQPRPAAATYCDAAETAMVPAEPLAEATATEAETAGTSSRSSRRRFRSRTGGGCRSPARAVFEAAPASSAAAAEAPQPGTAVEAAATGRRRETAATHQRDVRGTRSKTAVAAAATAKASMGNSNSSSNNSTGSSNNNTSSSNNSASSTNNSSTSNSGCLIKRRRGQPGSSSSSNMPPQPVASGGATATGADDTSNREGPRRARGATVPTRATLEAAGLATQRMPLQHSSYGSSSNSHAAAGAGLAPMLQLQELVLQHQRGSLFGGMMHWGHRHSSSVSNSNTMVVECRAPLSRVETEIRRTIQAGERAPLQQPQQQQPQQAESVMREFETDGGQQEQQQDCSGTATRVGSRSGERGLLAGRTPAEDGALSERQRQPRRGHAQQEQRQQQQLQREDGVESPDGSDPMDVDSHIKTGRHSGDDDPEYRDSPSEEDIISSSHSSSRSSSSSSDGEAAVIFDGEELADSDSSSPSNSSCNSSQSDGSSEDELGAGPEGEGHGEPLQRGAAGASSAGGDVAQESAQTRAESPIRAMPREQCTDLEQQHDASYGAAAGSREHSSSHCGGNSTAAVGAIQLYIHSVPVPPHMPVMEALNLYGGCVALARRSGSSNWRDSSRSSGWFAPAGGVAYRRLQQMLQGGGSTFEMLLSTALLADLFPNTSTGSGSNSSTARQRGGAASLDALPAFLDSRRPVSVAAAPDAAAQTGGDDAPAAASAPATSSTERGERTSSNSRNEVLHVDLSGRFCIMAEGSTAPAAPTGAAASETAALGKSLWDNAHTIDYLVLPAAAKARNSSNNSKSSCSELLTTEGLRLGRETPLVTSLVHPALAAERLLQQLHQDQQEQQRATPATCYEPREPQQEPQQQQRVLEDLAGWCVCRSRKETAATAAYLRGDCNNWHRRDLLMHAASDEAAPLFYALPSAGVGVTRRSSSSRGEQNLTAAPKSTGVARPALPDSSDMPAASDEALLLPSVFEDAASSAAPFVVLLLYVHNLLQQLPRLYAYASIANNTNPNDSDSATATAAASTLFRAAASSRGLCGHPLGLCSSSTGETAGAAVVAADIPCWSSVSAKAGAILADPVAAVTCHGRTPYWLRRLVFACPFLFPLQLRLLLLLQQQLGVMRGQFIYKVRLKEAAELLLGQRQSSSSSSTSVQPLLNIPTAGISSSKALLVQRLRPLLQLQGAASGASSSRREQEILADLEGGASLPRTKVKMPRSHLVESAAKVMDHLLASNRSSEEQPVLEVEFAGEEGVGQGPTNEFYAEVLDALLSWNDPELFLSCSNGGGLFPRAYLTDISRVPVDMLRRPRVSPLVQQQQRRVRRRANASRTDRAAPSEGAEDMEEDVEPSSSNNSSNSTGGSPCSEATAGGAETAAAERGRLERELFSHFRLLGQLSAKALVDGRSSTTDTGLHALFWEAVARPLLHHERLKPCSCMEPAPKNGVGGASIEGTGLRLGACHCGCTAAAVAAVAAVDVALGRSLQQMLRHRAGGNEVKDMCCSFVLPQSGGGVLIEGGDNILVSNASLDYFIQRLAFVMLAEGIFLQASAFRLGFGSFCPLSALSPLLPMEVSSVLFGDRERTRQDRFWTLSHLRAHVTPDHGFTASSAVYGHFLEVLSDFNPSQRAAFLKFVTGSTILPAGGFAGFRPLMKVVRKNPASGSGGSDYLLPSVMTCSNYIKLPSYSSKQILKERLLLALEEGQGAFTLS